MPAPGRHKSSSKEWPSSALVEATEDPESKRRPAGRLSLAVLGVAGVAPMATKDRAGAAEGMAFRGAGGVVFELLEEGKFFLGWQGGKGPPARTLIEKVGLEGLGWDTGLAWATQGWGRPTALHGANFRAK